MLDRKTLKATLAEAAAAPILLGWRIVDRPPVVGDRVFSEIPQQLGCDGDPGPYIHVWGGIWEVEQISEEHAMNGQPYAVKIRGCRGWCSLCSVETVEWR